MKGHSGRVVFLWWVSCPRPKDLVRAAHGGARWQAKESMVKSELT